MDEVSIDVDHNFTDADGHPKTMLSLDTSSTTLLIYLRPPEIELFASVDSRKWEDGSIEIGSCANSPVFWSTDEDELICLVGPEDESWGVAVSMPRSTLPRIRAALRAGG